MIKLASGVADSVCVPHCASVFLASPYKEYTLEDWASIPPHEMASIIKKASCWAKNANYIIPYLDYVVKQPKLPRKLDEMVKVYGIGKKSAALILEAVYRDRRGGVAVDRHLKRAFPALHWVHSGTKDETEMSVQVEWWLPKDEWHNVNLVICGLMQLLQAEDKAKLVKIMAQNSSDPLINGLVTRIDKVATSMKRDEKSAEKFS